MANEIKSTEFVIIYSGITLARCEDFSFSINKKEIDITTLDGNGWDEIIAGNKSWEVSTNALYTRAGDLDTLLQDFINSDDTVTISVQTSTVGDKYVSGEAINLTLEYSGSKDDVVKYSAKFKGTGALTIMTVA